MATVLSTITEQYNFARQFKNNIALWMQVTQQLIAMSTTLQARGWQTGGSNQIADTALDGSTIDPSTGVVPGPCLMLTSSQLTLDCESFANALSTFVAPYATEFARISSSW